VKTTRKQSVVPREQHSQPVTSRLMMRQPVSKMKGLTFRVVLLAHSANAPTPKVLKMHQMTIYKRPDQTLYQFFAIFVDLDSDTAPRRGHPCPPPHSKMPISLHTSECPRLFPLHKHRLHNLSSTIPSMTNKDNQELKPLEYVQKYMHKGLPSASPLPAAPAAPAAPAYDQRTQHDHPKKQKETTKLPTSLPVFVASFTPFGTFPLHPSRLS